MRITSKDLQAQLEIVNETLGVSFDLNNAPHYGGWALTTDNGSRIVCHRCPPKEMSKFLLGMVNAYRILKGN
jgi:hypothetical protein